MVERFIQVRQLATVSATMPTRAIEPDRAELLTVERFASAAAGRDWFLRRNGNNSKPEN